MYDDVTCLSNVQDVKGLWNNFFHFSRLLAILQLLVGGCRSVWGDHVTHSFMLDKEVWEKDHLGVGIVETANATSSRPPCKL